MTATDGRIRNGADGPGPAGPSAPDEELPGPPRATPPDGGPAVARIRARRRPGPAAGDATPSGAVPPALARRAGRHAATEAESSGHTPPPGYRPRHAAPDAETEQFQVPLEHADPGSDALSAVPARRDPSAREHRPTPPAASPDLVDPTPVRGLPLASTFPASAVTATPSGPFPRPDEDDRPRYRGDPDADDDGGPPRERVRVVLAERRSPTRAVGTVTEIEQQTATGELLLGNLMRAQLLGAVRLALVAVLVLAALPVLFLALPAWTDVSVAGVGLPWLVLGVLPFPLLLGLAAAHTRAAERRELDFADDVED